MRFDDDAKKIMYGDRKCKLPDRDGRLEVINPEITPIFKKVIDDMEKRDKRGDKDDRRDRDRRRYSRDSPSRSRSKSNRKKRDKEKKPEMFKKRLLFFGIPLEMDENNVKEILEKKGVDVIKSTWENYDKMEYLAINLKNEI